MKKLYLALLISIPFLLQAQRSRVDSASIYRQEMFNLYRAHMDSLYRSEAYVRAQENYKRLERKNNGYTGFTIFLDALNSDYAQFNQLLADEGFPALEETVLRIGLGTSIKSNRTLVDFSYFIIGLNSKSKKGDEEITAGLSNALQIDIGYNLLKSTKWSIYPYGGLSLRFSTITYSKDPIENTNYTGMWDMLADGEDIRLSSTRVGYQLGLGFDIPIYQDKDKSMTALMFIKAGMNRPLWKDRYQHGDLPKYNTGIKQGIWNVTLGFKLAGMY